MTKYNICGTCGATLSDSELESRGHQCSRTVSQVRRIAARRHAAGLPPEDRETGLSPEDRENVDRLIASVAATAEPKRKTAPRTSTRPVGFATLLAGLVILCLALFAALTLIPSANHDLGVTIYSLLYYISPSVATDFMQWWQTWSIAAAVVSASAGVPVAGAVFIQQLRRRFG